MSIKNLVSKIRNQQKTHKRLSNNIVKDIYENVLGVNIPIEGVPVTRANDIKISGLIVADLIERIIDLEGEENVDTNSNRNANSPIISDSGD